MSDKIQIDAPHKDDVTIVIATSDGWKSYEIDRIAFAGSPVMQAIFDNLGERLVFRPNKFSEDIEREGYEKGFKEGYEAGYNMGGYDTLSKIIPQS